MQLVALPAHLYQELDDVGSVYKVALVGDTPHEEQRHLTSTGLSVSFSSE